MYRVHQLNIYKFLLYTGVIPFKREVTTMAEANIDLDSICGAALVMGFPRATTGIIEFTGTASREAKKTYSPTGSLGSSAASSALPAATSSTAKATAFVPTREAIDSRLELLRTNEYVLPVEGKYWSSLGDCLAGKEPGYKGEIGKDKAEELKLYDPEASVIRVYHGSVTFPRRE